MKYDSLHAYSIAYTWLYTKQTIQSSVMVFYCLPLAFFSQLTFVVVSC